MSFRSDLKKAGVPADYHDEAVKNLRKGSLLGVVSFIVGLFAPIVVGLALLFRLVKWEDDHMPWYLSWFDNNVSINGDGYGMLQYDGTWVNKADDVVIKNGFGRAFSYSDPSYNGDCYYAEGHHPRSRWARWIWLGWRNRASALAMQMGETFDPVTWVTTYGRVSTDRTDSSLAVYNRDGIWQIKETRVVFFGKLSMNRNFGFKVNNTESEPNSPAMCIFIPFAFKGIKKK